MITGFNTNAGYRGRTFHVQTEDSGSRNPHVISHLYFGGTILASERTDYGDRLDSEDLLQVVRDLMEAQHKAMLRRLKNGDFDRVIAERLEGRRGEGREPAAPGAPAQGEAVTSPAYAEADAPRAAAAEPEAREKPLDEVILEYLVQKARDRAARSAKG